MVPYPDPTSPHASHVGKANPRSGTKPEVALRRELHRLGLRFRKDHLIRATGARTHVDVAFSRARLAVYIDGCFWHQCPDHFHMPKSNLAYWVPKLERNVARDRLVDEALAADGWQVLRIWEHTTAAEAADAVIDALAPLGHARALAVQAGRVRALDEGHG